MLISAELSEKLQLALREASKSSQNKLDDDADSLTTNAAIDLDVRNILISEELTRFINYWFVEAMDSVLKKLETEVIRTSILKRFAQEYQFGTDSFFAVTIIDGIVVVSVGEKVDNRIPLFAISAADEKHINFFYRSKFAKHQVAMQYQPWPEITNSEEVQTKMERILNDFMVPPPPHGTEKKRPIAQINSYQAAQDDQHFEGEVYGRVFRALGI